VVGIHIVGGKVVETGFPIVRRGLRPRNLVKKMTRSEIYFSLIGNGIMAFGECPSLTGNMFLGVSN